MAPDTRLLSNNNDSDLLEISGVRGASGRRTAALAGCLPPLRHTTGRQNQAQVQHVLRSEEEGGGKKDIKHIFALEESGVFPAGSHCSTLSPAPLPPQTAAAAAAALYWYSGI